MKQTQEVSSWTWVQVIKMSWSVAFCLRPPTYSYLLQISRPTIHSLFTHREASSLMWKAKHSQLHCILETFHTTSFLDSCLVTNEKTWLYWPMKLALASLKKVLRTGLPPELQATRKANSTEAFSEMPFRARRDASVVQSPGCSFRRPGFDF